MLAGLAAQRKGEAKLNQELKLAYENGISLLEISGFTGISQYHVRRRLASVGAKKGVKDAG
jgi:hypothetical protein